MHVTVWNRAWGGYYVMMLWVGAAPLRLGLARGKPEEAEAAVILERASRRGLRSSSRPSSTLR